MSSPKAPKAPTPPAAKPQPTPAPKPAATNSQLPFGRTHFLRMGLGVAVLLVGFLLLASEGFVDATQFSVSLWVAPLVIAAGYILIGVGILHRPKGPKANDA
ncbi:MAG: DUF3098 domain-containing protein [Bacteroidia bacterium]|nr:DUF3098 domain-containing protein [Bacteroidia bacterium]